MASATLPELERRVIAMEERNRFADLAHKQLEIADSRTAEAIKELTRTISEPPKPDGTGGGLIIELARLRSEVKTDRRVFLAVVSVVFSLITLAGPWVRLALEAAFGIHGGVQ